MVTEAAIAKHDRMVDRSIKSIDRSIDTAIRDYIANLESRLLTVPTAETVRAIIYQDRTTLEAFYAVFGRTVTAVALNQIEMLGLAINSTNQTVLSTIVRTAESELANETNSWIEELIAALILAAVAGSPLENFRQLVRQGIENIGKRIKNIVTDLVLRVDAAFGINLMRASGITRFRYAGGTISTSRDFCRSMNGRVFTEAEIRRIWDTQTWGGKRPGDPFVVRGGYNCRHYWVPATEDSENTNT